MAEVLELPQLSQRDRMADVQIRRRWIDAKLDGKRTTACKLVHEIALGDDVGGTALDDVQLIDRADHVRPPHACGTARPAVYES